MENSRNREMEQEIRKSMDSFILRTPDFVQPECGGLAWQLREKK